MSNHTQGENISNFFVYALVNERPTHAHALKGSLVKFVHHQVFEAIYSDQPEISGNCLRLYCERHLQNAENLQHKPVTQLVFAVLRCKFEKSKFSWNFLTSSLANSRRKTIFKRIGGLHCKLMPESYWTKELCFLLKYQARLLVQVHSSMFRT